MKDKIPFNISNRMLSLCTEISLILGKYEGLSVPKPQPQLRRNNQIKTVQASLAIEGNTLTLDQVTAIFDKKRIIGNKKEILEVKNAILTYEMAHEFNPYSTKSLLNAHKTLMTGLISDAGRWRTSAVGIFKGSQVSHVAPKHNLVPKLMDQLFDLLKKDQDTHDFIKACVMHYEIEFIHPFTDGNGRLGRLWQHLILFKSNPLFEFIPIESVIKKHQKEYYSALERSDKDGHSTVFVEFSLNIMLEALREFFDDLSPQTITAESRLDLAREHFKSKKFKRKEYLALFKTISTATASRDLKTGADQGILKVSGTKALTLYLFV